jgi:hypothetical protein
MSETLLHRRKTFSGGQKEDVVLMVEQRHENVYQGIEQLVTTARDNKAFGFGISNLGVHFSILSHFPDPIWKCWKSKLVCLGKVRLY